MLIPRMYAGAGAIRRRPDVPVNFVDFFGSSSINNSINHVMDSQLQYSSYYAFEMFDGSATNTWVWSYSTEILTSSIDTTGAWADLYCFRPTVLNAVKMQVGNKGLPHRIQVYGSNTGAFQEADRVFVLEGTVDLTGMAAYDWTDYFVKETNNIPYRFFRIYLLDQMDYLDGITDYRFHGLSEFAFHIEEGYTTEEKFFSMMSVASRVVTASTGTTPDNAFSSSVNCWKIGTSFVPDCWLQFQFPSTAKRKFYGWSIVDYQNATYGRGVPGNYSLLMSDTGAFAGEETTLFDNVTFNAGSMAPTDVYVRSPWQMLGTPTAPATYLRWVFHSWNYLGGTESDPGISRIRLGLSQTAYS